MIPDSELLDSILEALDLSRAEPGVGFLQALFARFNARVPFENASKIVRDAEVSEANAKPRTPEIFWADHIAAGTGGTCFARVAAFDALLQALGFPARRLLGRVERDDDHAALAIASPAGESIADVGFPLPALLPARPGSVETALGELLVASTDRGLSVAFVGGVPEGPRALEIFLAPVTEERFLELWRQTFRPGARFLTRVVLRKDFGNRVVSYANGEVRVDDLHSRLRIPLREPRAAALSDLFGIDAEILSRAFAICGEDPAPVPEASLTAYLEVAASPQEAFAAIATSAGYRRLVQGVADVVSEDPTEAGFRLTLAAPGDAAPPTVDEVSPAIAERRLRLERRTGTATLTSSYGVDARGGKTYLIREAALAGAREDLLRNDSMRGRLAGMLALDLLAWARML
ncbi:MAG: arylamine N-acetyltransferase [Acidobacteriota bacterium]